LRIYVREKGNYTAGADPYKDIGGSGPSDGDGALLKDLTGFFLFSFFLFFFHVSHMKALTARRRNAPAAFAGTGGGGSVTGM
jgi:hypothetical protein